MGYFKDMQLIADEITGLVEAAQCDQLDDYAHYHNYRAKRRVLIDTSGNTETVEGTMVPVGPVRVFIPDDCYPKHVIVSALPKRKADAQALVPFLNDHAGYGTYKALV